MADNNTPSSDNNEGYTPTGAGSSLGSAAPSVSAQPGRVLVVILIALVGLGFILYSVFSGSDKPGLPPKTGKINDVVPAAQAPVELVPPPVETPITPPSLPAKPSTADIAPPVLPPPIEPPNVNANTPTNQARLARIKSGMLVKDGGVQQSSDGDKKTPPPAAGNNPNSAFADSVSRTSAEEVTAGKIKDLNFTIAQGKIIEAVLETAINSELPGQIRGIVSRDVFGENGRIALVPKGSRLIGTYNTSVQRGQSRVYIVWTRVIRPDGVDIFVNSPGIDALGRSGMSGYVDNKFFQTYANALLGTIVDVGVAAGGQAIIGGGNTSTTTNTDGSTTSSGKPAAIAMQQGVENLSGVTKNIVTGIMDERPTITVDQGTKISVFVNKDLIFPPELIQQGRMIP